jgi:predicted enzyme related to lactoylglutathione lyase
VTDAKGLAMSVRWLHVMIDLPAEVDDAATRFWSRALGWAVGEPWRDHREFRSFEPPSGDSYVARQLIEHGTPRVHLDVAVDDVEETAARMEALGARTGPAMPHWSVMTSPGGMPYCLVPHRDDSRAPAAVAWADHGRHRSRLVQVCVDSPPSRHEAEVAFWQAATQWRWAASDGREFAGKLYPESGSPVQLLFQRLDDDAPATRAHIDLGADDVEAEADRLVAAGAQRRWTGRGWITLEDPAGLLFCATGNGP